MTRQPTRDRELERALVRFNARVLGTMLGVLAALGLTIGTLVLLVRGGESPGTMLSLLRHFFPGYGISVVGALIGGLWAGAVGYATGFVIARAYGPWMLRTPVRRVSRAREPGDPDDRVALLGPLPAALVTGSLLALALLVATNWLWFRYGYESPHLALLANYLPGYRTNPAGSVIGALWLFLYGFLAAGAVAWVYDRVVIWRFPEE